MRTIQTLVVEPDPRFRATVVEMLREEGIPVREAPSASAAGRLIDQEEPDLVLLAMRLPDGDGLSLLPGILNAHPSCCVVVMTAFSSVATAVEAMRLGALDYLPKPFSAEQLLVAVRRALETRALRRQVDRLTGRDSARFGVEALVGESAAIQRLRAEVRKIAPSQAATILLIGESGSGKDLVASILHYCSPRARQAFVPINCSAIPEPLMESEVFGHERGAFTHATSRKLGLFELADGGSVFLDEVAELPLGLQAKLLRFLEEQRFRRVGGTGEISVDVRVIAATNVDLEEAVHAGEFRGDLYYRLRVVPISVPPLRERKEDIPLLVCHFVDHFNKKLRKRFTDVAPDALELLAAHAWPGNVRELKNVIERVMLLESGPVIEARMLLLGPGAGAPGGAPARKPRAPAGEELSIERLQLQALVKALERTGGNQSEAARLLGVSRETVRAMMRRHQVALKTSVVSAGGSLEGLGDERP